MLLAMPNPITRLNAALEGRYRIESELGEGGMATVYLADDLKHERKVALKVLKPELAAVVGAERFLWEIRLAAKLQHRHILPLHDSGEADGFLYYVMPYIEGETLKERLGLEYQLPVDDAVRIATDVAENERVNRLLLALAVGSLLCSTSCSWIGLTEVTLEFVTTSLPNGVENVEYREPLVVTGGDRDNIFTIVAGSLPPGLFISNSPGSTPDIPETGALVLGLPTTAGTYAFTVEVAVDEDLGDVTATQQLAITILEQPVLLASDLCSANPGYAVATFEDADLATAVWNEVGFVGLDPTCDQVAALTALAVNGVVSSLVGMQNLTGLTDLELSGNSISDISPLQGLTSLTTLGLGANSITDITPLTGLTSLTELDLGINSIADIGPLSGLTSLTTLRLIENSITDITPLDGLTSLTVLHLNTNSISDIGPLGGLTSLTILRLNRNSISDIGPLGGLTDLTDLELFQNLVTDLDALNGLTGLTSLVVGVNQITSVSLSGLTSLVRLHLADNSITDVTLSGLTSLTNLNLTGNGSITDVSLDGLASLTDLRLDRMSITNIRLSGLTSLSALDLSHNSISDISALSVSEFASLSSLRLSGNSITDISVLSGFIGLNLTDLRLRHNTISDIGALTGLTSLTDLDLAVNPTLANIQPLLDNADNGGLGPGDSVDLQATIVSCTDVALLRAKGVSVLANC